MFSATDAAFSGFKAGREHFRALLIWAVVFGAISFVLGAVMIQSMGPTLMELQAVGQQTQPDPAQTLAMLRRIGPVMGVYMLFALVLYSVVYAAVNRMVLRPEDSRLAYLRLGADEVRQLVLMILFGLLMTLLYIVGVVGVVALAGAAATANAGLAVGAGFLGALGVLALLVFVAVRLSLASAQTFDTGRINLFGSWALTRGRFWPILGAYLLSLIMLLIVYLLLLAIMSAAAMAVGGGMGAAGQIFRPDFSSIATLYTPAFIVYSVIDALATPFLWLIAYCPAPTIYKALKAG